MAELGPEEWRRRASSFIGQHCTLCHEPLTGRSASTNMAVHRECGLRDVVGGIGHLLDHELWCIARDDPDAGLTYRQSALLVAAYEEIVGIDGSVDHD